MSETSILIAGTGKITPAELAKLPTPPATETHIPIPHARYRELLADYADVTRGGRGDPGRKLGLKHPELYAFAGSMSGALDITRREASLPRWGQTWRIWTIFGLRLSARRNEDVFELIRGAR
jgi:hypothetical protein